ncbi:hypothetical protein AQUCO_02300032v1 [Aquilegia coerulea]|uniref:O-acyltransferase WSD1 C-terminal domain-containing protein n=1 Tax=Aquilegia coerulea TaxID=218851 RepID=A0A2G5DCN1_AQUCA|nr:hypothetical protein AQUCO_02300032v1 [Aquilegia coerulea]
MCFRNGHLKYMSAQVQLICFVFKCKLINDMQQLCLRSSSLSLWMQSLTFTTASWMGQLRLTATMEKNFIDSQLLYSCMKEAFENIFQAACGGDK